MTLEPEDNKRKNNIVEIESKFADKRLPENEKCNLTKFLEKVAPLISGQLQDFNGHVTLHIEDGELTKWKSKTSGRYKD